MRFLYNRDVVVATANPDFESGDPLPSPATTTHPVPVTSDASTLPTLGKTSANGSSTSFHLTPATKALIAVIAVTSFLTIFALCCWCLHKRHRRRQDDPVLAKARKLERHYEKAEITHSTGIQWVPAKELDGARSPKRWSVDPKRLTTGSMRQQVYGTESAGYWF